MDFSRLRALAAFAVLGLTCLVAGCWLRVEYQPEWKLLDTTQHPPAIRPWMVEADCYSQMARVQRILDGQGLIQNHFDVENWPEGLIPSTTAPFDYAILLLYVPLLPFTNHPLDWAGALVSPVLWIALVVFWMFFRSRKFNLTGRSLLIIGSTALPAFIWATACGRPRHQSLILALMAVGLTAEYERWHVELTPKRTWNILAGVIWGLACWTSLFEPVFVVVCLVSFNLVVRRRESPAFLVSFGLVMLVALLVEGVHIFNPATLTPEYRQYLLNWLQSIYEVHGSSFAVFMNKATLVFITLPFVAWRLLAREGDRTTDIFLVLLTTFLCILTFNQERWIYYASLGELFLIARYCQEALDPGTRLVAMGTTGFKTSHWPTPWHLGRVIISCTGQFLVLLAFFLGMADADLKALTTPLPVPYQPSLDLAEVSRAINGKGGVLAPWWLSPGLLYFSGQPIVSGSSHCGITGIVASAKFYTATDWTVAEAILRERKVRWIVVYDNPQLAYPVLNTSQQILGLPESTEDDPGDAESTMAQILAEDAVQEGVLPHQLQLRAVTPLLKLYEYVPDTKSGQP